MSQQNPIPAGYCHCGCGRKTEIAEQTRAARGWVKGEPKRFVLGHGNTRKEPVAACAEVDCDRPVLARGLCKRHWQKVYRRENPDKHRQYDQNFKERHKDRILAERRAAYAANPERFIAYSRHYTIRRKYGITVDEYNAFISRGCAICGDKEDPRMALDHCHATGKIRDALCSNCNNGLGRFADDPVRLRAAAEYIGRHR